jgi:hypothetical protein
MAPILNRFCIVNLSYESNDSFLDEFLQDEADLAKNLVTFTEKEITLRQKKYLRDGLKMMFRTLFRSFEEENANPDKESVYTMDINNQVYNNMYDDDSRYVYNFISGRTLWYLYKITLSFLHKGLTMEEHDAAILNMVFGLIGLGANTFTEKQGKSYLKHTENLYRQLYDALSSGKAAVLSETQCASLDFRNKTIADAINEWILFRESSMSGNSGDANLDALITHIGKSYGTAAEDTERLRQRITFNKADLYVFTNDMQRLDYLADILEEDSEGDFSAKLRTIRDACSALRNEAVQLMMKSTL